MAAETRRIRNRPKKLIIILSVIFILTANDGRVNANEKKVNDDKPGAIVSRANPEPRILRDLEYVPGGHQRNKLDLYLPKQAAEQGQTYDKLPLIIWVHGGAWLAGSKDNCPALRFLRKGYAVASINYRLSQHAIFPAQIEDCKAAIRWLRANSNKYGLDADRTGVWGASAIWAGNIACWLNR